MAKNQFSVVLEQNKLDGKNYHDWFRNLKIVLDSEHKTYVLNGPPPEEVPDDSTEAEIETVRKWKEDDIQARCLMLANMTPQLQRQHESMQHASEIHQHLKDLFQVADRSLRYTIASELYGRKLREGGDVLEHGLKMIEGIERLEAFGEINKNQLYEDLILHSLPPSFNQFRVNFLLADKQHTHIELINLLKNAQETMSSSEKPVLVAQPSKASLPKASKTTKGKKKKKTGAKTATKATGGVSKKGPSKSSQRKNKLCFHCNQPGHWKRDCKEYLATLATGTFLVELYNLTPDHSTWVFDTGCGAHLVNDRQVLQQSRDLRQGDMALTLGNGKRVHAVAVGRVRLEFASSFSLILEDVYFVPNLIKNIVSVSVLDKLGFTFLIRNGIFHILHNDSYISLGTLSNGLYVFNNQTNLLQLSTKKRSLSSDDTYLWHARLGHISEGRLRALTSSGALKVSLGDLPTCESCLKGKMTKRPFAGQMERAQGLLDLVHTDICGPLSVTTQGGHSYFITFTDDFSRYGYVYLLRHKSDAFGKFREFQNEVENQLERKIKALRSDRGGEYLSAEFQSYLKDQGILSEWTPPYTPQLNGVSERRNRTLMDCVRSMMASADLPSFFWGYALETATRLLNIAPSKSVPKTPYELWHKKVPTYSYLRVWGCDAYVKRLVGDKLDPRSRLCKFVGYPRETAGYYFYDPVDQKVFVSRNARFLEEPNPTIGKDSEHLVGLDENPDQAPETQTVETIELPPPSIQLPRRTPRVPRPPERYTGLIGETEESVGDPRTFEEALLDKDSGKWQEAMEIEMDSMRTNEVWTLVDLPPGAKPVGCKWLYKRKLDADGNVATYKARLVAKGYTQRPGIDFEDTFSPVAMPKSIRILLAIAAYHDYEIWQMDVKTAFLNGNIKEEIYMEQPMGFISSGSADKVCRLNRSIYGLKQASRSWNIRFDEAIKGYGFIKNTYEPCVYTKTSTDAVQFIIVYVDDILLIGNNKEEMTSSKEWLSSQFSMKDLGEANFVLGIKIFRDRTKRLLGLSQAQYIDKIVKRFNLEESKRGYLPERHGVVLSKSMSPQTDEEKEKMERTPYASAMGSIMYAMLCTRPDVAHALGVASRYQSDPGPAHWGAAKTILKYLRKTQDLFLVYGAKELVIEGFTDSSFQSDVDDFKSTSGYVFLLNGGAVTWKSNKQATVADSTTEAEYIAASEAAKEGVWIKNFVQELGVVPSCAQPIVVFCDNNGAIAQAKEPRSHQRSKHIQRRYHLIRDIIDRGDVKMERVASAENVADPLTKALPLSVFISHRERMGLKHVGSWL